MVRPGRRLVVRSVARGDADGESDIDLLIVAEDLQTAGLHARVAQLQTDVRSWTGNELKLVEHSPESWRKLERSKNPLVEQIRSYGVPLAERRMTPRDERSG